MSCPGSGEDLITNFATATANSSNETFSELFDACNCTTWKSDTTDAQAISIIRIITSVFSVIGSASIILLVLLTGKLNTAEVHPLFILSVADFILAILWLIGGVVWLNPDSNGWATNASDPHTGMCYVLAISTTMAEIVTFMLTAVYAQSALLRLREYYLNKGKLLPEQDKKKRLRYILTGASYILSWLLPLIIVLPVTEALVGIERTNEGCWCIVDFFNLRPDNGMMEKDSHFNRFAIIQASLVGPAFIITATLIVIYYAVTMWYIRKVYAFQATQQGGQNNNQSKTAKLQKIIKTVMVRLSFFVIIFLLCGAPTLAGSLAVWIEKNRLHLSEPSDKTILYVHAILAPMQGFFNAIVYGWSRKEFRKAVRLQTRERASSNYQSLNNSRVVQGANNSTPNQ